MLTPMRAVMLHGPGDVRVEEVPDPVPGPGELVVRVLAAVTCATDAKMAAAGAHPALGPLPAGLGHEVAGVVEAAGEGVAWPRPGDAVVVANSAPCGACRACGEGRPNLCADMTYLTGAFAERLLVPARIAARNVHPLPEGMAPAVAAIAEPLACAIHSARRAGDVDGRVVLVLGGGFQGRALTGLLARRGALVHVADPHAGRRDAAVRAGAAAVHDAPRHPAAAAALAAALPGGAGRRPGGRGGRPPGDVGAGAAAGPLGRGGARARRRAVRRGGRDPRVRHPLPRGHDPRRVSPHSGRVRARRCACCATRRSTCRTCCANPSGSMKCPRRCGCHRVRSTR